MFGDIKRTALLQNFPNPFNPETWIPYRLADDTNVSLSIYDLNGALVRELDLGHQRAGYYTDRTRAAYWDGRNEWGEQVATGIYSLTVTYGRLFEVAEDGNRQVTLSQKTWKVRELEDNTLLACCSVHQAAGDSWKTAEKQFLMKTIIVNRETTLSILVSVMLSA